MFDTVTKRPAIGNNPSTTQTVPSIQVGDLYRSRDNRPDHSGIVRITAVGNGSVTAVGLANHRHRSISLRRLQTRYERTSATA